MSRRFLVGLVCLAVASAAGCKGKSDGAGSAPPGTGAAIRAEPSTKEIIWTMGHKLALAALGNSQGGVGDAAGRLFEAAGVLGQALGITLPPLPTPTGDKIQDGAKALGYLLNDAGKPIAEQLRTSLGAAHLALFELAVKSELLNLLYIPGGEPDSTVQAILDAAERAAGDAGLPAVLWKPLLDTVARGASFEEVQEAIETMKKSVAEHLALAGA